MLDEVVDRTEALLGGVPPVVRGAVLAELALARLRGGRAATQARGLLVFAYYELPAVTAPLGYDPDRWIGQVRARRDERWGDDVRRHRELLVRPDPLPPLRPPPQP